MGFFYGAKLVFYIIKGRSDLIMDMTHNFYKQHYAYVSTSVSAAVALNEAPTYTPPRPTRPGVCQMITRTILSLIAFVVGFIFGYWLIQQLM